jgi:hypothetical protein
MTRTGAVLNGAEAPTFADLAAATAASQAVLADPAATRAERLTALQHEADLFSAYERRADGNAELDADAELEAGI